jgi:predicted AlkP superfamily phosphohydrolase/phosphomutase
LAATGIGFPLSSCKSTTGTDKKVIVLGFDGLDPNILQFMIDSGRAPNFKKLAQKGSFSRLRTTMPALSPVAWSSFITGMTPGGHGIGDFVMRDPNSYMPVSSIYEIRDADLSVNIGGYNIPVKGGGARSLRQGKPFWAYLTEQGIPASILKIPTNFPVDETCTRGISGMGTPDLDGGFGTFTYYTTDWFEDYPDLSGGRVIHLEKEGNILRTELPGPQNSLAASEPDNNDPYSNYLKVPLNVQLDPAADAVRIDVQGNTLVLKPGEFSDWVKLDFEMVPLLGSVSGIARFLVKEIRPHFKLYVTPINIDPSSQAMPVTYPESYGEELAQELGPFWTKGLPADTKAFDHGVFKDEDYVSQSELILKERLAIFDYEWSKFKSGLFYFYVSSTDQDAHMLWRNYDKTHPMHKESDIRFAGYIHHLYEEMDKVVGKVLPAVDDKTLVMICSDHGFAQFGRRFHLNTWLRQQGYLVLKPGAELKEKSTVLDIDWNQTIAYGIGFNGLYFNLKGREINGIVEPEKVQQLAARISRELTSINDSETGKKPVSRVYPREEIYSGEMTADMPELLVGYTPGFAAASDSVLGGTGRDVIDTNPRAWSGDHSMARDLVPGTLICSRPFRKKDPSILDLPVTILDFFGIGKPPQMVGGSIFSPEKA